MILENWYKSIIKSSKEFGRCVSIPVRKLISLVKKCALFHIFKFMYHGCFVFLNLSFCIWTTVEYCFYVINTKEWMARIHHDVSNKKCLYILNRRGVGIFKVSRITKLTNIFESLTYLGNLFHDSLSFYFYHCLCTEFRNTCPHIKKK